MSFWDPLRTSWVLWASMRRGFSQIGTRTSAPHTPPSVQSRGGLLRSVALECHQPDGSIAPIFEFPVSYVGTGEGDRKFTADRAALARFLAKLQSVPRGTVYRIFCSYNGSHSDQRGWGPGSRASVSGMRSYSFGTLAAGPHGSAGL